MDGLTSELHYAELLLYFRFGPCSHNEGCLGWDIRCKKMSGSLAWWRHFSAAMFFLLQLSLQLVQLTLRQALVHFPGYLYVNFIFLYNFPRNLVSTCLVEDIVDKHCKSHSSVCAAILMILQKRVNVGQSL